jgi:pyrroline-5-carboxylate reductase
LGNEFYSKVMAQQYTFENTIAIIGGGNIGMAIAEGLAQSGKYNASQIIITRHQNDLPKDLYHGGFTFTSDNQYAVKNARVIILAVLPILAPVILKDIKSEVTNNHIVISCVTGYTMDSIEEFVGKDVSVIRAMPNTAIRIRESMTCLSANEKAKSVIDEVEALFNLVGITLVIEEEYMSSATALGSCGIAFFLRSIRAASQGGTQIGFHAEDAQLIAAQTAKGAAELLLKLGSHPEEEIDMVTTPRGVTIAGLNEMEHNGFSSALIKGIVTSYEKTKK